MNYSVYLRIFDVCIGLHFRRYNQGKIYTVLLYIQQHHVLFKVFKVLKKEALGSPKQAYTWLNNN
jgi:hypothetical protein